MLVNTLASTAFHVISVLCHPSFKTVGEIQGIPVGTQTYCVIAVPFAPESRTHATKEACNQSLAAYMKYDERGALEEEAMAAGGYLTGVCHEGSADLPFEDQGDAGRALRKSIVDKYGPKGDGV